MLDVIRHIAVFLVSHIFIFLSFVIGLSVDWRDVREQFRRRVFLRGLLVALLLVPLLTLLIIKLLPVRPIAHGILLLLAVSPGVPMLVENSRKMHGRYPLAVALSLALTTGAVLLLPASLWLLRALFPVELHANPAAVFMKILPPFILPIAVGMFLRSAVPDGARRILPFARALYVAALLIALVATVVLGVRELKYVDGWAFLAVVVTGAGALILGDLAGRPHTQDRVTLALAASLGSPALTLFVASSSFPQLQLLPAMSACLLLKVAVMIPYQLWAGRRTKREETTPPSSWSDRRVPA